MSVYYSLYNLKIFQSIFVSVYIYNRILFKEHASPRSPSARTHTLQQGKHEETRSSYKKLRSRLATLTDGYLLWKKTGCPAGKIPNQEQTILQISREKRKEAYWQTSSAAASCRACCSSWSVPSETRPHLAYSPPCRHLNNSVQFSSRWYLCAWKSPYVLHLISQKLPQQCLWNGSNALSCPFKEDQECTYKLTLTGHAAQTEHFVLCQQHQWTFSGV